MRRNDLDWARSLVVYTLVLYHSARVFDSFDPFYVKSSVTLSAADAVLLALGSWSMPLLFAVAGAATWFALARRSAGQYVGERVRRLLVPFVFGVAVIVPPQSFIAARAHGCEGGYLGYWFGPFFTQWGDLTGYDGGFTTGQLWFLAFLFVIAVALVPVLVRLRRADSRSRAGRVMAAVRRPAVFVSCSVPLTLLSLAPEIGDKNLLVSAGWFLLGFAALPADEFLAWARRHRWLLLAIGAIVEAAVRILEIAWRYPTGVTGHSAVTAIGHNVATLLLIAGIVGVGASRLLPSRALPWLNRATMPYYVVHQTVIVLLAAWILTWDLPAGAAFALLILASAAVSVALAAVIVRIDWLGPLFGLRRRPAARATPTTAAS